MEQTDRGIWGYLLGIRGRRRKRLPYLNNNWHSHLTDIELLLFSASALASEAEPVFPSLGASSASAASWRGGFPPESTPSESGLLPGAGMQEAGAKRKTWRPKPTSTSPSLSTFSTRPVFPTVWSHQCNKLIQGGANGGVLLVMAATFWPKSWLFLLLLFFAMWKA